MLKAYYKTWVKNSEINAKQRALVSDVGVVLGEFFCSRTSEIVAKLPPTNSENNTANTILNTCSQDDHGDVTSLLGDAGAEIENSIFVGTFQNCYMPIQATEPQNQRCAWFPYCDKLKKECGRQMKGCRFLKHQLQDLEFVRQMKQAKNEMKKGYKRRYMQQKRRALKEASEAE